MRISMSIY